MRRPCTDPQAVAITPSGGTAYVSNRGAGTVSVIVFIHGSRLPDEEGEGVANNIRDLGFAVEWANARRPVRVSHPVSVLVGGSW